MEKFEPSSFWVKRDGIDTLNIVTTGFKRENLKVQVDSSGKLRVTGEGGDGGRQFSKTYSVPEGCDLPLIRARFESDSNTLVITFPKAAASPAADTVDKTEPQKTDNKDKDNGDQDRQKKPTEPPAAGQRRLRMWAPGRDKLVYTFVFVLVLLLAGACFYLSYELRKAAAAKKIIMVVPE